MHKRFYMYMRTYIYIYIHMYLNISIYVYIYNIQFTRYIDMFNHLLSAELTLTPGLQLERGAPWPRH